MKTTGFNKEPFLNGLMLLFPAHITRPLASMSKASLKLSITALTEELPGAQMNEVTNVVSMPHCQRRQPQPGLMESCLTITAADCSCCRLSELIHFPRVLLPHFNDATSNVASNKARAHFLTNVEHCLCGDGILKALYYSQI